MMERSTTVLAGDVLEEILSRLPVRQLLRLRCVCKSWCAYIDDSSFMKKQYQFQYDMCRAQGDVPIFLHKTSFPINDHARVSLLSKQHGDDVISDLMSALQRDSTPVLTNASVFLDTLCCRGVVNGVVLLESRDKHLSLWNPATREFKVVPYWAFVQGDIFTRAFAHIIGFGFDTMSNDFKVVGYVNRGFVTHRPEPIDQFEMYSLRTNSWKKLRGPPGFVIVDHPNTDSYLNGVHYWAADVLDRDELPYSIKCRPVILSFNLNTEVFKVFDPPQHAFAIVAGADFARRIGMYKDSLAWIVRRNDDERDPTVCCFNVWVVAKFDDDGCSGAPLSWQCLYKIGPLPVSDGPSLRTFRMNGDVLFLIRTDASGRESETNLYNPSTCTFKKLGTDFSSCFRYIESLFPLSLERNRK